MDSVASAGCVVNRDDSCSVLSIQQLANMQSMHLASLKSVIGQILPKSVSKNVLRMLMYRCLIRIRNDEIVRRAYQTGGDCSFI